MNYTGTADNPMITTGAFKTYKGWIPHLRNDLSDIQWRQYREGLPAVILALSGYTVASQALQYYPADPAQCHYRAMQHAVRLAVALLFLAVLHGTFIMHVAVALLAHYALTRAAVSRRVLGPLAAWAVPAGVWLLARTHDGLPFWKLARVLAPLDAYAGVVRWHIGFNLLALRMISWSMDWHWTVSAQGGASATGEPLSGT
jgi:protein-cysteine N-palmitoyltransferase HHAT